MINNAKKNMEPGDGGEMWTLDGSRGFRGVPSNSTSHRRGRHCRNSMDIRQHGIVAMAAMIRRTLSSAVGRYGGQVQQLEGKVAPISFSSGPLLNI